MERCRSWLASTPRRRKPANHLYHQAIARHGGPGTTLSSLARGLPLLILPQGADQYVIGDLVLAAGVGLLLAPPDVTPSTIRANVLALLDEPVYREGARRLQCEIAAMPGPEVAVHLIEEVVAAGS